MANYKCLYPDGSIQEGFEAGLRMHYELLKEQSPIIPDEIKLQEKESWQDLPFLSTVDDSLINAYYPDLIHYEQNTPNILEKGKALDNRYFQSEIELFWHLSLMKYPSAIAYMAGLAKVQPYSILELGVGGDSGISTSLFHYWCKTQGGKLDSVDRHPLGKTWVRYKDVSWWTFWQGDDIAMLNSGNLSLYYELIFLDTIHTYEHTKKEIAICSKMTDAIIFDDATIPDIKQALNEFLENNPEWIKTKLWENDLIVLIERRPYATQD